MNSHTSDTVVLRTEKCRESIPLLRVVIGGLAALLGMRVDQLDDLQLAVETLVVEERSYLGDLALHITVEERGLSLRLDGLCNDQVRELLLSPESYTATGKYLINVRMLLESLVDSFSVLKGADGGFAVQMSKRTD